MARNAAAAAAEVDGCESQKQRGPSEHNFGGKLHSGYAHATALDRDREEDRPRYQEVSQTRYARLLWLCCP